MSIYPKYDFRYKLDERSNTELSNSLLLEPWSELTRFWTSCQSSKKEQLQDVFSNAIQNNIASGRYNPLILSDYDHYPEFRLPILRGLLQLWMKYPLWYHDAGREITVGKIPGNINLTPELKLHLLDHIQMSGNWILQFSDDQPKEVGIWMTRPAQVTYQMISRLRTQS